MIPKEECLSACNYAQKGHKNGPSQALADHGDSRDEEKCRKQRLRRYQLQPFSPFAPDATIGCSNAGSRLNPCFRSRQGHQYDHQGKEEKRGAIDDDDAGDSMKSYGVLPAAGVSPGFDGQFQAQRGLLLWHFLQITQLDRLAHPVRQVAKRAIKQCTEILATQLLNQIEDERIDKSFFPGLIKLSKLGQRNLAPNCFLLGLLEAQADIAADPIEPGVQPIWRAYLREMAPCLQQRLLNRVVRCIGGSPAHGQSVAGGDGLRPARFLVGLPVCREVYSHRPGADRLHHHVAAH
jgi:hypothetical protein